MSRKCRKSPLRRIHCLDVPPDWRKSLFKNNFVPNHKPVFALNCFRDLVNNSSSVFNAGGFRCRYFKIPNFPRAALLFLQSYAWCQCAVAFQDSLKKKKKKMYRNETGKLRFWLNVYLGQGCHQNWHKSATERNLREKYRNMIFCPNEFWKSSLNSGKEIFNHHYRYRFYVCPSVSHFYTFLVDVVLKSEKDL